MRKIIFSATVLATVLAALQSSIAFSGILPGKYAGQGEWRDDAGHSGTYTVETNILATRLESKYDFTGGQANSNFTITPISEGFFKTQSDDGDQGSLYCLDVQCHMTSRQGLFEETLSFVDDHLYKLGSKKIDDGRTIVWQESLNRAK